MAKMTGPPSSTFRRKRNQGDADAKRKTDGLTFDEIRERRVESVNGQLNGILLPIGRRRRRSVHRLSFGGSLVSCAFLEFYRSSGIVRFYSLRRLLALENAMYNDTFRCPITS